MACLNCPNPEGISASDLANIEYCQGSEMVRRVDDDIQVEMCGVVLASLMTKYPGVFEVVPVDQLAKASDADLHVIDIREKAAVASSTILVRSFSD